MGALFQAVSSQLGNLGSGIAEARDARTTEANENEKAQFDQQMRLKEFQRQQQQDALQKQVQDSLMKARASGSIVDMGTYQDPATKKWSRQFYNLDTKQTIQLPLPGDPESVVRSEELQDSITDRQRTLETQRQTNRLELKKLSDADALRRKQSPSGAGKGKAGGAAYPLAVTRWYKALRGGEVDSQIATVEAMLKASDEETRGTNDQYVLGLQEKLKQLRAQQSQIWQWAYQRAGGEAPGGAGGGATGPTTSVTPPAKVGGGGSPANMSFDANGNPVAAPTN